MDYLERYRKVLDQIDSDILYLISERMLHVKAIADYKKQHNLPVYYPKREKEVIKKRRARAAELGLDPKLAEEITKLLIRYARASERKHIK